MRSRTFPLTEDGYFNYIKVAVAYLIANATRFGISAARQAILTGKLNAYTTAYNKTSQPASRTKNDISDRNTAKTALTAETRDVYSGLADSVLTDTDRNTLNLPKPGPRTPAPIPTTKPVIVGINTENRLQQLVSFADSATPTSRAKPDGVQGCQLWCAIVPIGTPAPPADTKNYRFMAVDTSDPYLAVFDAADGGKMAWWIVRWVNSRGQTGSWSLAEGAIIQP